MIAKLLRLLPEGLSRALTRHAAPVAIGAVALLVFAGIAVAALVSPSAIGIQAARISQTTDLPAVVGSGLLQQDSDRDGLSDALENYLYGTDASDWNSSGLGIPDGWLAQFGYDPLSPLTRAARGAGPPTDALPAAYGGAYPQELTPTLDVYYAYGRPAGYQPGVDEPWWRGAPHADPSKWDQSGAGIPTGWLLRYGLDPVGVQADRVAEGSLGNLTIAQAFEHNTDPTKADSDADGLDDWMEIHVHKTAPSRFDTARTGIADGWLVRFGLNPFDTTVGAQDPDLDGLTNLEEFVLSYDTFRAEVAASGLAVIYSKGLDPLDWDTAKSGIPDGWYVKYGLSPFGGDVDTVIGRASAFPEVRNLDSAPEGQAPLPDIVMTVREAYSYGRPSEWNESTQGVWWGGTNPATGDTDDDGLPDVIEIRGWYANVTSETGPEAKPRVYVATSNPLEGDSDGDGLTDVEEYRGRTSCGAAPGADARLFPVTDPRNRDTAFSGLSDLEKVCGVDRGQLRYDFRNESSSTSGFDPTRADSAGDYMRDGARLDFWHERYLGYLANPRYPYESSAYKTVHEWMNEYSRLKTLSDGERIAQLRPDADVDADGLPNVLDSDPAGGLHNERFPAPPGTAASKAYFLGGPQIDPALYRFTEFSSAVPHSATDPANPDTDGDGLPDEWETRFGQIDTLVGGWNLDPSDEDSNDDGVNDARANNDGDVVTWYAYFRGGEGFERVANTFEFDNELELVAGTNPNELSTMGDGVPDGWKAFWGSRVSDDTWPNLVATRDTRIGDLATERSGQIEAAMALSPIQPLVDLKDVGAKTTGYVRHATNLSTCDVQSEALQALLRTGERFPDDAPCFAGQDLDGKEIRVALIEGVFRLTYRKEAELRTNPYLADSDGDGAPDAYEAYFGVKSPGGSLYPDPALDDGAKNPDDDGIGILDECRSADNGLTCGFRTLRFPGDPLAYGAGADPNLADTDTDGIQDGIEFNAGLDALDPGDIDTFRDPNIDSDRDRLADYVELTGLGSKSIFDADTRTNPKDADSDKDSLLDGETLTLTYRKTPSAAVDAATKESEVDVNARIEAWCARGIAHRTALAGGGAPTLGDVCRPGMASTVSGDLSISFLGERTFGAAFGFRPDRATSASLLQPAAQRVPDGWLAYYSENPKERPVSVDDYMVNRPSWWVEAQHGVWWWGRPPGDSEPEDLDVDGLNDIVGEDPFPSLRLDRVAHDGVMVVDPRGVESFVAGAATPDDSRVRAQRLGDGAGDPQFARDRSAAATSAAGVPVRLDRARVAVIDVALPNGSSLTKSAEFHVTGRVVVDERNPGGGLLEGSEEQRVGVPNRTVIVGAFSPTRGAILGVGFTNATGNFTIVANITQQLRVDVPPGLVVLGAVNGTVSRNLDPNALGTGEETAGERNRIVVWTTNTSATLAPGAPGYADHQAWLANAQGVAAQRLTHATRFAVSAPLEVTVRSDAVVTTTIASTMENGAPIVGDLKLEDASGALLTDRNVRVRWTGVEPPVEFLNLSTSREGIVNLTNLGLVASVARPDQYALVATFVSTDPYLNGTIATFPVQIRSPTVITATVDRAAATVGDPLVVSGTVLTRSVALAGGATGSAPVAREQVSVSIGGATETTTLDDKGAFQVRISVPGSLAAGPTNVEIAFEGSESDAPSELLVPITVKRTASIEGLNRIEGPRSISVTLRGRLVDNEGQGFAGPIEVTASGFRLATGRAGDNGAFTIVMPLGALPLGPQSLRVHFPGDAGHAPTENFTQGRVTSTTAIGIEGAPATLVRGGLITLTATLRDDARQPAAGVPVATYWRGERVGLAATDAAGRVVVTIETNATERPALASLGVEAMPGVTSVYQPSTASATVRVVQGTLLELAPASVHRGAVAFTGRLLDDEGRPLAAAPIDVSFAGTSLGEARTARNGTFELVRVLADDHPLGEALATAAYEGTATLAGAVNESAWHVRTPLSLQLTQLGPFVRGENAPIVGRLVDDRGAPVTATLLARLGERELGAVRIANGIVQGALPVPGDMARGPATIELRANATDAHDAFRVAYEATVQLRPKVEVKLPALAVRGFAFSGELTLRDDKGAPLPNTTFAYALSKGGSPVFGQTDAEGRATLASVAPVSGDTFLTLSVRGASDVVGTEYKTSTLRLIGPATPIGYASLIFGILIVLAIVGLVVGAAMLRRRQLREVRDILDETIRDLLAGNEYAGTIFLAYRRLSAHLARHGFAEKASETPREFAVGVRKALPISSTPLKELIRLFEEARYSDHEVGSVERDRAVESLSLVRAELDRAIGKGATAEQGGAPA